MEQLPWFVWIVFAGMAFGLTMAVISTITEHKQKIAALAAGVEGDRRLLEKLDSIDLRLAKIEKVLDDVPA
ncbi:MAG: hypothetical protein ABW204_01245 [Microbacteriaceae bacterium]